MDGGERKNKRMGFYSRSAESGEPVAPRQAATVILLAPAGTGVRVLLMRRHGRQRFMARAMVFPGGALDPSDQDVELAAVSSLTGEAAAARIQELSLAPEMALGLHFAAIRETFEEAGVLLAVTREGGAPDLKDKQAAGRFNAYRSQIHDGEIHLLDLARRENLKYRPERLIPFSRWITPEVESVRFDARFFLAELPATQVAHEDAVELTHSCWVTPAEALEKAETGEFELMPPTLVLLEELAGYADLGALFDAASRRTIRPMMPQFYQDDNEAMLLLPDDPDYSTTTGYGLPPRAGARTRMVRRDGLWKRLANPH